MLVQMQEENNRVIHLRYNRGFVEGWFRRGGGGGGGEGRGGCAPSYSVDSCLQRSNGVWWVEVLSYHVFLSSSGMYCPTISSVIKLNLGSFDRSYAMASIKHVS